MYIAGDGITTPIQVNIQAGFKPVTKLAIKFHDLENGDYYSIDRGAAEDVYETELTVYGTETSVNDVIDAIEANRLATTTPNELYFYNLSESGEKLFGADVDNTQTVDTYADAFKVNISTVNLRAQNTWKGWSVSFMARCLSPTFTGAATFPVLCPLPGMRADSEYTINRMWAYTGENFIADQYSDYGIWSGTFKTEYANMRDLRRFVATQRGVEFSLASTKLVGVTNLFGRRSSGYPYNVRILELDDYGNTSPDWWSGKITIAEAF